ncbi:retinoblastoma-like protein 2 isoform X2 [Aplysia californica]|uniref:Retinoblastoma-like protein 2 isoform X2 n=1 Tax=Aplysia californica TaxID=6500 RepID=A0ABM0JZS1_APLCA|nr:retinoblastoma-like protein 2 isoform X2 [Aplysia californica]
MNTIFLDLTNTSQLSLGLLRSKTCRIFSRHKLVPGALQCEVAVTGLVFQARCPISFCRCVHSTITMGLSEEGEENVFHRFEEVCLDLNMDASTKDEAWQNYQKMLANFSLEGDQMHWLACALYEACRRTSVPTVGRGTVEGNCVSLTRLLRSSKFSLIQFFNKMRKWSDMASLPKSFRDKIDKLERNFAVSTVIFKKFEPIFLDIFVNPSHELPRQHRGRKQRSVHMKNRKWTKNGLQLVEGRYPCTSNEVFNFAWTMFVQVKGNFPAISDDLVNSYHLLLCCIDWIFANAVLGARKDLLNPDFEGLPEDFHAATWRPGASAPCIVQFLCERHDGLVVEAKTIKEHWWKPHVRRLFEKKVLKGKVDNLSGILEIGNFEENVKTISNLYEEFVLGVGDFDERIFLGEDANEEIGTPGGQTSAADLAQQMQVKRSTLKQHFDETKSLTPSTPLTGRRYLKEKDPTSVTPVSTATQSVSRLQTLLAGCKTMPSDTLLELFKSCSRNPNEEIVQRVKEMGEMFCKFYAKSIENQAGAPIDFGRKRLQLGESLYFKTLEGIVQGEKKRITGSDGSQRKIDLLGLLENDFFHRSLFACCLEIVIFSYNSQRTFPWIVDIFELSPYHFYKVIEIIIRAEKGLSRDVVKHLNHIEESILESYAWKSDSPLWEALREQSVPNCEEVMPGTHMDSKGAPTTGSSSGFPFHARHPRLRSLVGDIKAAIQKSSEQVTSPVAPMAADRFSSPTPGNAKRRLFGVGPSVTTLPFSSQGSTVGTSSSVSPVITVISSTAHVASTNTTPAQMVPPQAKSILLSQLKGGASDTLLVSNKAASTLAPTTVLPRSDSPPPTTTIVSTTTSGTDSPAPGASTVTSSSTSTATIVSVGEPPEAISSENSSSNSPTPVASASGSTVVSSAAATSNGDSPTASTGGKAPSGQTQQAIVAMMEDGRQILIPVQIAQPSASSTTSPAPGSQQSTATNSVSTSTTPSTSASPGAGSAKKPAYFQVHYKLDAKNEQPPDHTYNKPKKTGSLALFFRKVYHLCSVRLRDLFEKLDLEDEALLRKIWTCFEFALISHPPLMCDRHLDQLIMCSIYLIAKVTERPLTFQNIMKCYRLQPQAQSHVYRSVLLSNRHRHGSGSSDSSKSNGGGSGTSSPVTIETRSEANSRDRDKKREPPVRSSSTLPQPHPGSQPPTPTRFLGSGADFDPEEERGDLINFYNRVFLKKIRSFALRFAEKVGETSNTPKLSPLPAVRCLQSSPRRVSSHHSLFISPHHAGSPVPAHATGGMTYCINRSPSKDLQAINRMIKANTPASKRALEVDRDDSVHSPAKRLALPYTLLRRLHGLQAVIDNTNAP